MKTAMKVPKTVAAVLKNSDSENEETTRKAATGNRKPKASSSKTITQARRVKNSLTEGCLEN